MVLELHVWGPAFGLPSIDPQCAAAISYCRQSLPRDGWTLIPSNDTHVSPLVQLPALCHDQTWVAGFSNIVAYLDEISSGEWNLDRNLNDLQRADLVAYSSFIESRAQPLLDLSLYVSSDNYLTVTRQALGDILAWPDNWTLPHQLRDQAKKRSEHLGLSSLDVDTAQDDQTRDSGLTAHIPKSLRKPNQTVSSLLGRNVQKTKFRLDAVTADLFEPLADLLDQKKWLLGDSISSLDCLAIGYLSLLQQPQLPQGWARNALMTRYTNLGQWTQLQCSQILGPAVDIALVLGQKDDPSSAKSWLPWEPPRQRTVQQTLHAVADQCISAIPGLGTRYRISEIPHLQNGQGYIREKQVYLAKGQQHRELYINVLSSSIATASVLGWLLWKGLLIIPRHMPRQPRGPKFGEAGSILGLG
ncbi:hypothetical protein PV10_02201 [Exophiala mesophila]|uniref:Mitochondrial outer membrane transport complex Sam37/metaxin N-terminal domain-containing protein n=1 Tax=Exophiala mesophila TaxID=212818 RepID=A0A0D1ZKK4_EXOME|nr:uncharacterized protein PV10_02201 [Exophiala mesophila]KIV94434.1 hypothetical protein PV10_02201 [Exophiala mesophila]